MIDLSQLHEPFDPSVVSWRVGSISKKDPKKATALAYIDARDVMDRLDKVIGSENWQCRYIGFGEKTCCEIDIWVEGRGWVTKSNGAGDSNVEAEKGAFSDAFKRAAVAWGIGRYLYDVKNVWVEIDEYKHITKPELKRLEGLLPKPKPKSNVEDPALTALYASAKENASEGRKAFDEFWSEIDTDQRVALKSNDKIMQECKKLIEAKSE